MKDEVNKCNLDKDSNNKNLKDEIMKNKKLEDIIKNLSTIMTNTIYQYYEQYYVFHAINPILPKLNHLIILE